YYKISHPHIITFPAGYPVPLPGSDAVGVADAAVEAPTESKVTELLGKLDTVREMLKDLLISDELANDSRVTK
ncbi:hypothetical protein A2U01_0033661, partial [Trifolium medium]|nr:hypothetical protein [Trifolium medium]